MRAAAPRPDTFNSAARRTLIVGACLGLALLEAAMRLVASGDGTNALPLLIVFGVLGVTWGGLALAMGWGIARVHPATAVGRIFFYLGAFLGCAAIDTTVRRMITRAVGGSTPVPWPGTMLYFADRTLIVFIAIVLAIAAFNAHDLFVARRRDALALDAQVAHARIAALEDQLHPHFLFNALGAVIELAAEAPEQAARMLRQLASVLEFSLAHRGVEVTLAEELAGLQPYLDVQRIRFADWISIDVEMEKEAAQLLVPSMILQPLVENSIRHGLSGRDLPGRILIDAVRRKDRLVIDVRDNGAGLRGTSSFDGHGLGLANIRERIAVLYGDAALLTLREEPGGGTIARLEVPARPASERGDVPESPASSAGATANRLVAFAAARPWIAIPAAWAVWGILWSQQSIAYLAFRGRLDGRSIPEIAAHDFVTVMLWAPLTPVMLRMLRRVPMRREGLAWRVAVHLSTAIAIAMAHALIAQIVTGSAIAGFSPQAVSDLIWGVLAYAVVLAAGYHASIRAWLIERDLAEASARAELARSQLDAATSHVRPHELVERLDQIGRMLPYDTQQAERALARLGDQLRASLDTMVPA